LAAAAGLLFAEWDITLILAHMPADVAKFVAGWKTISPRSKRVRFLRWPSRYAAVSFSGIAPALLTSRTNLSETLKESGVVDLRPAARVICLRNALVVAEISLSPRPSGGCRFAGEKLYGPAQRE